METLNMSVEERKRMVLLSRVQDGQLKLVQTSEMLELSYRQTKRIWARFRETGAAGLVHRLRQKASNHHLDPAFRDRVLERYAERYVGFGPTLASEHLETEHLKVHPETLRRWLLDRKLWHRERRRRVRRQRRERRACRGELVQMDGSKHDWFQGRRPPAVLMVMIDDATSHTYARFYEEETTAAAMDVFERYVRRHGLPLALYPDQDSIYKINRPTTLAEELKALLPRTQFGRAMDHLGVRIICARSPQAKGRVERRHRLLQDRLVKEMHLQGIQDLEEANRFLDRTFLPTLNRRWTVPAAQPANVHRPLPPGVRLAEVLCHEEERTVANDHTVQWGQRWLQIDPRQTPCPRPRCMVQVRQLRDGQLLLFYRGQRLAFARLPARPKPVVTPVPLRAPKPSGHKPAPDHPWRRGPVKLSSPAGGTPGRSWIPVPDNNPKGTFLSS